MYEDFFKSQEYISASKPDNLHHQDVARVQKPCPNTNGSFIAETKLYTLDGVVYYKLICSECGADLKDCEDSILEHILPGSITVMPRTVNPTDIGSNPIPAASASRQFEQFTGQSDYEQPRF